MHYIYQEEITHFQKNADIVQLCQFCWSIGGGAAWTDHSNSSGWCFGFCYHYYWAHTIIKLFAQAKGSAYYVNFIIRNNPNLWKTQSVRIIWEQFLENILQWPLSQEWQKKYHNKDTYSKQVYSISLETRLYKGNITSL